MSCGSKPTGHKKFCRGCGTGINPGQVICLNCGAAVSATASAPAAGVGGAPKNRIVAAVFAILLGWIGGHKFYMGSWGWGIIFLVLFLTYIPAIIGLIEGIMYLAKTDEAFAEKYPPETQAPFRW
jgi:TM2 domain-containing membrane protein YozV